MTKVKQAISTHTAPVNLVFWAVLVGILSALPILERQQWYRDLTGRTPFKDVVIEEVQAKGKELWVRGHFTLRPSKADCTRGPISVYTRRGVEPWQIATFGAQEPEGTPDDRPPGTQTFGWWIITSNIETPDEASMYVTHFCDGQKQTNKVLQIAWADAP